MTPEQLGAIALTLLVLAIVPGPSDVAVVARTLTAGLQQGLMMVVGIVIADSLLMGIALLSLSGVATTLGPLFVWGQGLCGLYLIGVGIQAWRSPPVALSLASPASAVPLSHYSSVVSGLLITLGDPKAIAFYLGFLPAFVDLSTLSLRDTLTILLVAASVVGGVKSSYASLSQRSRALLQSVRQQQRLQRIASALLIGTGIWLIGRLWG